MTVVFVSNPNHAEHAVEGHPESPERLEAVLALLEECGLLDRLVRTEPRQPVDEELSWLHTLSYVEALRHACAQGGGWADPDTYIVPGSCAAAWSAARAALAASRAVPPRPAAPAPWA